MTYLLIMRALSSTMRFLSVLMLLLCVNQRQWALAAACIPLVLLSTYLAWDVKRASTRAHEAPPHMKQ